MERLRVVNAIQYTPMKIRSNIIGRQHQSLVGTVVIDAKFGRKDHGSIPHNCDQ
jgi:hypothetical protein